VRHRPRAARPSRLTRRAARELSAALQPRGAASAVASERAAAALVASLPGGPFGWAAAEPPAPAAPDEWEAHAGWLRPCDELLCMAVPKRKTTPSRKGIRSTGKHLRFASVISTCLTCGRVKRTAHAHCPHCMGGRVAVGNGADGGAGEGASGAPP